MGLTIRDDGSESHVIDAMAIVPPGAHRVMAASADRLLNGGVESVLYAYGADITLGNGADELVLERSDGTVIDAVMWDGGPAFPDPSGASMSLDFDATDELANDDGANWCEATTPYGDGDSGTPGAANDSCGPVGPVDGDLDGYTDDVDCDDTDPDVNPGAVEVPGNEVDEDCDGVIEPAPPVDEDLDGFTDDVDCDDTDPDVYPGAIEVLNGVDDDCNDIVDDLPAGALSVEDLVIGELVVTEIMQNPAAVSDGDGEWIEIYNASGVDVDLDGLEVSDLGSDSFVVDTSIVVAAGEYAVLAKNADAATNGGLPVDFEYGSGMTLGNSDDEVVLSNSTTVLDTVAYDGGPAFPDPSGASMNLDPGATDELANDDGANWCEASNSYGDGDLGTPGAANDGC